MMHVGLAAWIIQDGNYGDFEVGRAYRFALEFYPHKVAIASRASAAPRLSRVSGGLHEARGTIAFCSDRAWVVDFGVPAFQETKPPRQAKPGGSVSGRVYIGVDPFFYFEHLKNEKGMPDLFRHWVIRRIFLETRTMIAASRCRAVSSTFMRFVLSDGCALASPSTVPQAIEAGVPGVGGA